MAGDMVQRVGWTLPTALSSVRLVLAALFPVLGWEGRIACVALAGLTDALDGYTARRLGVASWWGAVLDASTDKLFVVVAFLSLVVDGVLTPWQFALILPRDVAVLTILGLFALQRQWGAMREMDHRFLGKLTTATQIAYLLAMVVFPEAATLATALFCLAAATSFAAALDYTLTLAPLALRRRKPLAA